MAQEERGSGPAAFAEDFVRAYQERFAEHHLAWSIFFVAHLSDLRRQLGNLDDALILAAFGLGPVGARARPPRHRSGPGREPHVGPPDATAIGTNAKRLADITGIPRETVRRRLDAFRRRGWVEQVEDRSWRFVLGQDGRARVAADLEEAHAGLLDRLARLQAEFARLHRRATG